MRYPDEHEIVDPATKLPGKVAAEIAPLVRDAERGYRVFRQRFRDDTSIWQEEPEIIVDFAAKVFKTLAVLALTDAAGDFEAFRHAIGWEGGAAETALQYAHFLYKDVQGGRMPFTWQWRTVEPRIWGLMNEAEDLWHNRNPVPRGWEEFLSDGSDPHEEACPSQAPSAGKLRRGKADRRPPSDLFEEYRAANPNMTYSQMAGRLGVSRDSLFKMKGEQAWVRDYAYKAAADLLGCRPEDLHPREIPKPRRQRRAKLPQALSQTQT